MVSKTQQIESNSLSDPNFVRTSLKKTKKIKEKEENKIKNNEKRERKNDNKMEKIIKRERKNNNKTEKIIKKKERKNNNKTRITSYYEPLDTAPRQRRQI